MKIRSTLRLFMLAYVAFACLFADAQTTITIGTGTSSTYTYGPIYRSSSSSSFDYSRYAYIYTNSELNIPTGAVIQKVEWYKNSVDSLVTSDYSYLDIWMANTTATTASSTAWSAVTAASTRVFQDSFNSTNNVQSTVGWYEFPISSFTYTGNSLQVALDWDCSASSSSPTSGSFNWLYGSAPATQSFYSNSSSAPATLSSTSANRPNIRITYTYTPPTIDAGLSAILSPSTVSCVGSQSVQVDLKNFGVDTLTSVSVNWSVNGSAQTATSWTGSLPTDSVASVSLGTITVTAGSTYDLKIWTSAPNASTDGAAYNDTLERTVLSGMSGEFTVGGSGTPDYATLTAALSALNTNGMCDDVRLLVNEGTYTGQYTLGGISGLGANATLEIVSNSSNTNLPIFTYSATGTSDNYVFQFDNASYVTLDSLEINATGTSYGRVVVLSNNNNNITVSNSILRGVYSTLTSSNLTVFYCNTTSSLDENITIENNTVLNGSIGIYLYGGSSAVEGNNVIRNNTIDSFYYYGIQSYYQQDLVIEGNYVRDNNQYTSPRGLFCNYNYSALISKNTVLIGGSSSPFGMYLDYNDGTAANPTRIINNMVSMYNASATGTVYGIEVYAAENNHVAHNTVAVYGGGSSSRALYLYASLAGDSIRSYNNALANFGGAYSLYATTANSGIVDNDYNSYYSSGSNLAYWGSARATLSDLQTANGFDGNSIAVEPIFTSSTDLHTTTSDLDEAAKVLSYVTDDIDGDSRASSPDIGADEFTPPPVDAGITSMVGNAFCAGTINTDVVLFNFATDTLKSVKIVREVSVNGGVSTPLDTLAWTGLLASSESAVVNLGTYVIGTDSYVFTFYTYKPNTFNDPNKSNDTLRTNTILASMEGTYTIGGTIPDYTTISLAIADLNAKGICDDVVLEIREGTYNEQVVFGAIGGLGSTNTLTVMSATGNTAMPLITFGPTASSDNYVVNVDGASFITFDGLEITTTGTTYSRALVMDNGVSNITVKNCKLVGMPDAASTSNFRATLFMNNNSVHRKVTIDNNTILNGSAGIYAYGSSSNRGDSTVMTNNTIEDFYYYGIYSYYQDNSVMTGNYILDDNSYSSPRGIYALYNIGMEISNNEVYIGGTSSPNGMYLDYNDGTPSKPVVISNNMISMYNTAATGTVTGMEVYNAENNIVANNSIAVHGGSTSGRALYLYASGSGDSLYAYNNALANFGGGYALNGGSSTAIKASDYNNLYATGANLAYWSGSAQTSLSDLQTASGFETNSVNSNPVFVSTMDLHAKGITMNDAGTPLSFVTNDIDGDVRSAVSPDIGADEYTPPANDIAVVEILNEFERCAVTSQEVRVVITNFGTSTQNAYDLTLDISGAVSQTLTASGSNNLPTGALDTISVGSFSTAVGGVFNFTAYSTFISDEDLSNDTVSLNGINVDALPAAPTVSDQVVCINDAGSVTLEATGAANSYEWYNSDTSTTVLSTSSTYTVSLTNTDTFYVKGLYSSSISVGEPDNNFGSGGNYTFYTPGLLFDVAKDVVIDSVTVYTGGAGNVVVNIEDASGNSIFIDTTVVSTSGYQRIPVNANVAAGTGYKMLATNSNTGLYRNSSGGTFPYTESSGSITITDGTLSGYYYFFYDWAVTVEGCSSPLASVAVTVNETPEPTIANDTICKGEDAFLTVTSAVNQLSWYTSDTSTTPIAIGNSYFVSNVDSTMSFFINDLGSNGCYSPTKEVKVVVKATPEAPVANDTAICSGESVTLSAMGTTGDLHWYSNANGGTAIATGTTFTTAALSSTKVYYVSESIDGCDGPREDVIVSVNAKPSAPMVSNVPAICAGETATLMTNSGSNVMWYNSDMTTVLEAGNSYTTAALLANDTFFAVDNFNGCTSEATQVNVTVIEVPLAPTASNESSCAGSTVALTASSSAINTWYDAIGTMLFTGDVFTTPVLNETSTYFVAAGNGTCESTKTPVMVTVTPNVDADKSVVVCEGESVELSFNSSTLYNWYADATTTTVLFTASTVNTSATATDTFYAQAVGGNCTNERSMYIVRVDPKASVSSISGATICEGETANLMANAIGNVSWYATPSSTTVLGSGASFTTPVLSSTSIYYAQASNGQCVSDRLPVIVTVNPNPNADFASLDHGARVFVSAAETNEGYSHTWEIGDTTIIGGATAYADGYTGTVSVTHTIVNTITGCTSSSTMDVNVGSASVNELTLGEFILYPNPNSGSFVIDLPKKNHTYTMRMLNIAGQVVYATTEFTSDNNAVNVSLPVGMYFVEIADEETSSTIKIVVR